MRHLTEFAGTALLLIVCASLLSAQEQQETAVALGSADVRKLESTSTDSSTTLNALKKTPDGGGIGLFGRFLDDQRPIWASPARIRFSDMTWLVPVGGLTAGLLVTDRDFSAHLSHDPKTMSHYNTLSNAGLAALIGGAGGLWLMGHASHNQHWKETGFLAGEASINSLVAVEALKYSLRRQRPVQGDGSGAFFQGGGTSFPSEHTAAAWAVAGVVAHEYPGPFTKVMAYGLASLVDYSRIRSRQHFPSDVFVGSIMGNLIAQNIYSRHHDPELGGAPWQSISSLFKNRRGSVGSPYVPLDSWVYPAFDRLMALNLIDSGFVGDRPWTRRECARLLNEAEEKLVDAGEGISEATRLVEALQHEFWAELESSSGSDVSTLRVESIYSRVENISGRPLQDGYHFGQTLINDIGRPYGEGWNSVTGFSTYATSGPWVAYVRGELQTAPGAPPLPLSARQVIASVDNVPVPPPTPSPAVAQFRPLDAYVGLNVTNWQVTFGKQSLWWGPGPGGAMMFSDNSAPINNMLRINRVTPVKLPSVLGWLGPLMTEFFLGQLSGSEFVLSPSGLVGQFGRPLNPQPFIHGQRFSFKPTRNFEFGFSRTVVYGGSGYPLTWHTFIRSVFSTANRGTYGTPEKPGDRRSGLDFSYRLPRLRKWLTFYGDGFTEDEYSPIAYSDRSAWHAGLYLSQFPMLHKLDLRVEGVFTDIPYHTYSPGVFYTNSTWRSGYRNDGVLMGSWIGRDGQGAQAWATYWLSPRNKIQLSYRHQKISQEFIPGGGTLTDLGARGDWWVHSNLSFSAAVQHERWLFPVIAQSAQRNVTASLQVTYWPPQMHIAAKHTPAQAIEDAKP
jgi:membrane-associated phospholipid phosphatase